MDNDKYSDLEQEEVSYECGHLIYDTTKMVAAGAAGLLAGPLAPLVAPVAVIVSAAKSIHDKYEREAERDGDD